MAKRRPKRLVCRWCGDECEKADDRDHRSAWTHGHPAVCPFRQDRMPALNGVHVGDVWRNRHTQNESTVVECRLGGYGTYTDREPVLVLTSARDDWHHDIPLWSLVEHWDPVTRPGEYPVPWETSNDRGYEERWADDAYRSPFYRGSTNERERAYWHATHHIDAQQNGCIDWRSERWQIDPDATGTQDELDLSWGEPMNENALPAALADVEEPDALDADGEVDAFAWADKAHARFQAKHGTTTPRAGEQLALTF